MTKQPPAMRDRSNPPSHAPAVASDASTAGSSSERPAGLRERKKADLRRRIAQAAIGLFRERGYERTTIDEIVKRVEVSQPTFYKYFPSKDAILREHALTGFASLLTQEAAASGTIEQRMRRYLQAIAAQMTEDRELWYAIAVSNAYNPIRDPELLSSSDAGTRLTEAVIEEGQRRGEFTIAYSAQRLASLLEGVMFRVCIEWGARYPNTRPLTEAVDEGFDLFVRAARPAASDRPARERVRPSAGTRASGGRAPKVLQRPAQARPTLPANRARVRALKPTPRPRGT